MNSTEDVFSDAELAEFETDCKRMDVPLPVILAFLKLMRKKGVQGASRVIISDRRIIAALDRAAELPHWWKSARLHYFCPKMTHAQIAQVIGAKREAVTRYLHDVQITEEVWANLPTEDY